MSDPILLVLPFPDAILNPNVKKHWGTKNSAKNAAKNAAYILTCELQIKLKENQRYAVEMVFCPPDRRGRDLDNLTAAMKSALDGMCLAFGINDRMIKPTPDWGPVGKPGRVEIRITEIGS